MKILYVATIAGTINSFLIPHIKLLIEHGHQVHIACNDANEINPELLNMGCKVVNLEFQRFPLKIENYTAYKKIEKLVLTEKYELVHTHTPVASFFTRLACRNIANLIILYTAHGFHFFKGAPLKNWLIFYTMERLASRWTDGIITVNNEDFYRAQRMHIRRKGNAYILPGIGVSRDKFKPVSIQEKSILRKEYGFKDDDFLLIYAAELNENKNQRFLIKALSILKNRIPNIKLLLAGKGKLREEYANYASSLKLAENVIFLGFRNDLNNLVPMCDIGVSSSSREGFGINLVEYMSCGLPVIATNNRGHREIVEDGVNGFLFGREKTNQFVEIIENIYLDKELRRKLGINAFDNSRRFTIEKSLKSMGTIYQRYCK